MPILNSTDPAPRAMDTRAQDCPLCGNGAEYYLVARQTRKHFLCSNCTQFQLAIDAEPHLTGAPPEWRSSLSNMAKAHPKGATLVIGHHPAMQDGSPVSHDYVENSQLPA